MIARALNNSKIFFLKRLSELSYNLREYFFKVFPFMTGFHKSELYGNNFANVYDYLFIPDVFSTKRYWFKETISLAITSIVILLIFLATLSILTNTSILIVLTSIIALTYFSLIVFKLYVVYKGFSYPLIDFTEEEINAITDEELPTYTIFVPLLHESEVIDQIVKALSSIDYPSHKIDMIIPLEGYDEATIEALEKADLPAHFRTTIIPYAEPQTKPKTLNIIFEEARGDFLVIYDAEIIPDSNQLKKAYLAFKKHPEISCFQTRLEHYNTDQNILTRLFNMEFSFYYDYFLPGLQKLGFPIPLSGHSTHFRTSVIRDIGAWDSYNVAEDCDIGMRMYRYGFRTAVINSVSREEAASTYWSWIMQRTRWMKGFIQTSIVHLRHPLRTKSEMGGWKNFGAFLLTVPGTVAVNFMNLISWMILIYWAITKSQFINSLYTQPILYISVSAFAIGIFLFTYLNLIGSFNRKKFHLIKYGLLTPFYWILLAFATSRAVYQTFTSPFMWEKTKHGSHLADS